MLGRLLQTGKGFTTLESSTEEEHTRSLLYPSTYHSRLSSPPSVGPVSSPTSRIGPFDDKGGLELNETKDLRVVIAQDAFGILDRPTLLYDSHRRETPAHTSPNARPSTEAFSGAGRTMTNLQPQAVETGNGAHARNRSSTVSGPSSAWSRTIKDADGGDRITQLLDCMFGVTSATKSGSSTKMHVLTGGQEQATVSSPLTKSASPGPMQSPRTPILRSRTSNQIQIGSQRSATSTKEEGPLQDMVLVTRMFSAPLPESKDTLLPKDVRYDHSTTEDSPEINPESPSQPGGSGKKQKLVEKKTPMFAIGVIFYLPPLPDPRGAGTAARPVSRASVALTSLPNSYGSDMPSSWTLLDAIPDSLSSSMSEHNSSEGRVEHITNIWDVILRSLSFVEQSARVEILRILQQVDQEMLNSTTKAPKGPQEQRTNQRNIYIRQPWALLHLRSLQKSCKQIVFRLWYALQIPHVATGLGFMDGHWLEESRYLVQVCGAKQQNFFLFNLLTSFLGNHTQWLERLGPDWYRRQFRALSKNRAPAQALASRTVIVTDRRSIARRLIFLLASFWPSTFCAESQSMTSSRVRSPLMTPNLTSSSPSNGELQEPARQSRHHGSHAHQVSFGQIDTRQLSTSVSSNGSARTTRSGLGTPHHFLGRKKSDDGSTRTASILAIPNGRNSFRKTSATNSTVTPNPATPVAYFSTNQDSYFPEGAVAEGAESLASADLAKHLRRGSSSAGNSSGPSIAWGSLLSNVSGLWGKRQESLPTSNPGTPSTGVSSYPARPKSAASSSGRLPRNKLESMVSEANMTRAVNPEQKDRLRISEDLALKHKDSPGGPEIQPPRLRVDRKDGVIDVDVNLPGFFSWNEGQDVANPLGLPHYSPSIKSFRGQESIRSNKSHAQLPKSGPSREKVNVAGYLRRYHEDFSLQAVKPYAELLDDIKDSMSREALTMGSGDHESLEPEDSDQWFNVCTTLVADVRTFTVQRLVLRRRRLSPSQNKQTGSISPVSGVDSSARIRPLSANVKEEQEEQFLTETVMDFDATLTDAVERMLHAADGFGRSAAAAHMRHSRTASSGTNGTSYTNSPSTSLPSSIKRMSRQTENVRSECLQAVEGALEEVVKSVNEDLVKHQKGRDIHGRASTGENMAKNGIRQENVLREGVKKWLLNVETRSVW